MLKKLHFKSLLLLAVMLMGGNFALADDFNTTYGHGDDTWTKSNFEDAETYYKSSISTASVASISGIFTGKTITSDVVITLNVATFGQGNNPTASKFKVFNSAACTSQVAATQSGTLPSSSTYTNVIYTVSQANAASFTDDLAIQIASGTKLIRLKSITVQFSYSTGGSSSVALPTFTPVGGTYIGTQHVTLDCETDGATIYYTTNGSTPTTSSNVYSSAIEVSSTTTIKAIAEKGGEESGVASAIYTIIPEVPGYNVNFEAGDLDCYTDWEFTNISLTSSNSNVKAHSDSHYGNTGGKASATIQTKNTVAAPGLLKFYVSKESNNDTASSWTVAVSSDGSEWTNVGDAASAASMGKGEWVEVTRNLSSYSNVYVRISYGSSTAVRAIDDISILPATAVEGIDLDKTTAEVSPTKTIKLTPIFTPADASNQNVTWTSDDLAVATVAAGVVTGVAEGTANITVTTEDGGFTATCAVTVRVIHPSSITLDKENATIEVGDEYQLTATVLPDDADDMSVSWESSNPEVATVSSTGLVTAVAKGSATITATTQDGNKTASCVVTVKAPAKPTFTLDFTSNDWGFSVSPTKTTGKNSYTNGATIELSSSTANGNGYYFDTDNLLLGKENASLTLPVFSFNVSKIKVYGADGASASVTFNIFVGDDAVSTEATSAKVTHTFDIAADKQASGKQYVLKVTNGNNTRISKIEVFGYDNVPVGAEGFATYCSPNALDFSDVTDLTAYTASLAGNIVSFDKITKDIPKETGVLLKAAKGTYKVPAVAASTTDVSGNALVGVTSEKTIGKTTNDNSNIVKYNYVLKDGNYGVGFYQVNNVNYKVRANSAYLAISYNAASPEAKLFIGLDGETAVEAVAAEVLPTGTAYNLQGQRVGNDYKGVVIVNGKKVIR